MHPGRATPKPWPGQSQCSKCNCRQLQRDDTDEGASLPLAFRMPFWALVSLQHPGWLFEDLLEQLLCFDRLLCTIHPCGLISDRCCFVVGKFACLPQTKAADFYWKTQSDFATWEHLAQDNGLCHCSTMGQPANN